MNKDKALKMAIEALESFEKVYGDTDLLMPHNFYKSLQACKEALEQPAQEYLTRAQQVIRANNSAQEPVAKGFIRSLVSIDKNGIETWKEEPFYTSPPSWQGLSDDEINNLHHKWIMNSGNKDTQYDFARAIEQALKEKNS